MAVSCVLECGLRARPCGPVLAALPGHGQRCCPLKTVKMSWENASSKDWGRARLAVGGSKAQTRWMLVATAAVKEGVAVEVDVNAPASVLVDTLLSLVRPPSGPRLSNFDLFPERRGLQSAILADCCWCAIPREDSAAFFVG